MIKRLEHDSLLAIEWFQDKRHLLVSPVGYKYENVWAQIGDEIIWESNKQKLLGLKIDRNSNFNEYVPSLCKKAGKRLAKISQSFRDYQISLALNREEFY